MFRSLSGMVTSLTQISNLMNQAQGIAFNVSSTMAAFVADLSAHPIPPATTARRLTADAQQRWQNSMSAFQQTLKVQAQVVQNVQADTATLTTLMNASQGAAAICRSQQATNQLLALSTKQQLQIQNLMAAQYRATALDQARNAEAEAGGPDRSSNLPRRQQRLHAAIGRTTDDEQSQRHRSIHADLHHLHR